MRSSTPIPTAPPVENWRTIGQRARIASEYARKVSRSCVGVPSGRRPWMWPIVAPAS